MGSQHDNRNPARIGAATAVLVLVLAGVSLAATAVPADPLPLAIEPPYLDAGPQQPGTSLDLEFVIFNDSDQDIRLKYIYAECDCTLTVPADGMVGMHGQYVLQAKLDLAGIDEGPVNEVITILTDNTRQPELKIPVSAWVAGERDYPNSGMTWRLK